MSSRPSPSPLAKERRLDAHVITNLNDDPLAYSPPRPLEERASPSIASRLTLNYDAEQGRWHMPPDPSLDSFRAQTPTSLKTKQEEEQSQPLQTGKLWNLYYSGSFVVRWTLFIVPVLVVIWIPGVLSLTTFPNASVWSVRLIFWSIWLSIVWAGWWAALAIASILPRIIKVTLGVIPGMRRYMDWMHALYRYIALVVWTIVIWASFNPLITIQEVNPGAKSTEAIGLLSRLLFALLLCAGALLFEKFSVQWIAGNFHERSYADRIANQRFAVYALVTLYRHSANIPGLQDHVMHVDDAKASHWGAKHIFRNIRRGIHSTTTTTATVFSNVASQITGGGSVLIPNSPRAIIKSTLQSAHKTRLLARRFFYSFAETDSKYLFVQDLQPLFTTKEEVARVYSLFDTDLNGDVSQEELEMACVEIHREQISLEHSIQDLDSAVGRLDNILISIYVVVAILIIAVALEAQLATLVTGAGTFILGLSWLVGGSLQEVLSSIIFLFIKYPFDVGDHVILNKEAYTVKEIGLLSTIFLDSTSSVVQVPNSVLNTLFIQNARRSPESSENFEFDVAYSTTFEDLDRLRERMIEFVNVNRRDYHPVFDVTVKDFPEQSKMTLSAVIKYKGNGQQGAVKARRRNKWICALKLALAEVRIYGPSGDPHAPPAVSRYTRVPWSTIHATDQHVGESGADTIDRDERLGTRTSRQWHLGDITTILASADNIFDTDED